MFPNNSGLRNEVIFDMLFDMRIFIRLVLGLLALFFITIMTAVFGIGGFLFTAGLYAVIFFAFFK